MRWVEKYDEEGDIKRHNRQPIAGMFDALPFYKHHL